MHSGSRGGWFLCEVNAEGSRPINRLIEKPCVEGPFGIKSEYS